MPRKPRFFLPDIPVHVVQRGHSRQPVFFEDQDYRVYLGWLAESAERYSCQLHAYVLMTNHVHILITPKDAQSVSRMMQYIGRRFVPYINRTYGFSGSIWEGRFKASLIQDENYLLNCMRYIELNPVRAGMTKSPGHYRWSSFHANASDAEDSLLSPHAMYLKLGNTSLQRAEVYNNLFSTHVGDLELEQIRAAWQTGTPLGNDEFIARVEKELKLKVGYAKRGRPKKITESG